MKAGDKVKFVDSRGAEREATVQEVHAVEDRNPALSVLVDGEDHPRARVPSKANRKARAAYWRK